MIALLRPTAGLLPSFAAALEQGWAPRNVDSEQARRDTLRQVREDPGGFLSGMDDDAARLPPIELPDGTMRERLPGIVRWMWDGEFCGTIGLRWQVGTDELPSHVLGHIGYAVVPWKRNRGHATAAVLAMLGEARLRGLKSLEITTDRDNAASIRTIEKAGGRLERVLTNVVWHDPDDEVLLYRIDLAGEL